MFVCWSESWTFLQDSGELSNIFACNLEPFTDILTPMSSTKERPHTVCHREKEKEREREREGERERKRERENEKESDREDGVRKKEFKKK